MDDSSEKNEIIQLDISTESIITRCLDQIKETNLKAYEMLIDRIQKGFFEQPQTKSALNKLTDQLLDTIQKKETKNAD